MKKSLLLFIVFTSIVFAQKDEKTDISKLMLKSNFSEVVKILEEKVAEGIKLSFNESFDLAISYQRLVNHRKAIPILQKLSEEKPKDFSVRFAIAESFNAMENLRVASNLYHEIVVMDSSNVVARIELAKIEIRRKNFEDAKRNFEYLAKSDSGNYYYRQQYGFCLYKLGELTKAESEFKNVLQINKYDSKAALWLAKIYFDREEYEEAIEIIKQSIEYNPVDLQLNQLAAEILFKMKKYSSAYVQFQNVIVLGDSSSAIFQKLGLSLYSSVATSDLVTDDEKKEKIEEAIEAFNKSIEKDDSANPLTLTYLGFCYKVLEDYEKAILYLEDALNAMTPDYIDRVYSVLGTSYELSEKYSKAIIAYSKSLKYSKDDSYTVFRLATLFDRYYADKSVALAHYEKYLRVNKNGDEKLIKYAEDSIERLKEAIHFGK